MRESEIACRAACRLGESPIWDERSGELYFVDILDKSLHAFTPSGGGLRSTEVAGEVSAICLTEDPAAQVLAVEHRLWLARGGRLLTLLGETEAEIADNRFNDCRADHAGRIWAGTNSRSRREGTAALYRMHRPRGLERVLAPATISNGIGWSPDSSQMYYVDSPTQRLDVLDFDPVEGSFENRRALARIDPADGLPDGLAVDAEGCIWLCLFGGGRLHRYSPSGELLEVVGLPVTNPTCPTLGGPDLSTLYVTSARHLLSAERLAAEPHAGDLIALPAPAPGLPAPRLGDWVDAT